MNPYYTHRPHLINLLNSFDYTQSVVCFEFGVGYGSSEIFHEYCEKHQNLSVYAFETDRSWFDEISSKFNRPNYIFQHLSKWSDMNYTTAETLDLSFIDQSPWEARIESLNQVKNISKNILIHDYDYFNKGLIDDIYDVSDKSFLGEIVSSFDISAFYDILPPTAIMIKK